MRSIISSLVALLGMTVVARADALSGIIFAGQGQASAVCWVFNAGTSPVKISNAQILNVIDGSIIKTFSNDCKMLPSARICMIAALVTLPRGQVLSAYSCRIVVAGSKANVSGSLEIRTASSVVTNSVALK